MGQSIFTGFVDFYFRFSSKINSVIVRLSVVYSHIQAHKARRNIIRSKGISVIDRQLKKTIKSYSKRRFGKSSYWPWLAVFAELRGSFVEGWIPNDYFRYYVLPEINPTTYAEISDHKTFDYQLFGEYAIRPLFLFVSGLFYDAAFKPVGESKVMSFFSEYNNLIVIKEDRGTKGKQVRIMHSTDFEKGKLNNKINYIIQPYVKQHIILQELYPESVNTFRVCTYMERRGKLCVKSVILRFGIDGLKVDNISAGGLCILFDSHGNPSSFSYDEYGIKQGECHKNTGYIFSNIKIPMFNDILDVCIEAHKKYPYVRIIGWDICVDEYGIPKILEWNADDPGFWTEEAYLGPFWPENSDL